MNKRLFSELAQSVKEMNAIRRGEMKPSRAFEVPAPDARMIRMRFRLSQTEFAGLLGISVATLRNWEQGLRRPKGPARVLLHVVELHPEAVRDASMPRSRDVTGHRPGNRTSKRAFVIPSRTGSHPKL